LLVNTMYSSRGKPDPSLSFPLHRKAARRRVE
jgi:hypothetical protein